MWLAISTRPNISNAVRSVAKYCSAPKAIHWKSPLGIHANINCTCGCGITYQRGTSVGKTEGRCDRLCVDLDRTIPVKNLSELKWYGGCRYSRDRKRGTLMISQ